MGNVGQSKKLNSDFRYRSSGPSYKSFFPALETVSRFVGKVHACLTIAKNQLTFVFSIKPVRECGLFQIVLQAVCTDPNCKSIRMLMIVRGC